MSTFPMKLIGDLVAVQPDEPETNGILLPAWQKSLQGKVIATGPGKPLIDGGFAPSQTKKGDRVTFGAAKGMESVYQGKSIRIMRDEDIDAVLE